MHSSLLRPVTVPPHLVGRPAPCDIFDARGTLLQASGSPMARHADPALRPRRLFCEATKADRISATNPIALMRSIGQTLGMVADRAASGAPIAADDLIGLAEALREVWFLDGDACIGYARLELFDRPSVCHAILSALFAAELASGSGASREAVANIAGAALTMNIGSMTRHDAMFADSEFDARHVSDEQRAHPAESARLLESFGSLPDDWLQAVLQHHENIDGSGYPFRLDRRHLSLPARMLRVADTLADRLLGRKSRPPRHWNIVQTRDMQHLVQHVFGGELKRIDHLLARQLMTALSAFPPGSLVRLSNGEVAVISRRRPETGAAPREAMSFVCANGRPMEAPRMRLLGTRDCRIHSYVQEDLHKLPRYDWPQIWGYR